MQERGSFAAGRHCFILVLTRRRVYERERRYARTREVARPEKGKEALCIFCVILLQRTEILYHHRNTQPTDTSINSSKGGVGLRRHVKRSVTRRAQAGR